MKPLSKKEVSTVVAIEWSFILTVYLLYYTHQLKEPKLIFAFLKLLTVIPYMMYILCIICKYCSQTMTPLDVLVEAAIFEGPAIIKLREQSE